MYVNYAILVGLFTQTQEEKHIVAL